MVWICSECGHEIDYVSYSTSGQSYGSYYPDSGDHNEDGTDFEGDTYYTCPECGDEVCPDELRSTDDDDESDDSERPIYMPHTQADNVNEPSLDEDPQSSRVVLANAYSKWDTNGSKNDSVSCPECGMDIAKNSNEVINACSFCGFIIEEPKLEQIKEPTEQELDPDDQENYVD